MSGDKFSSECKNKLKYCTLTVGLSYICIPNRSKIRSFAKTGKKDGNFTKYGVQPQTTDCHVVREIKAFMCKKRSVVLTQKSGLRTANKPCLHCKQGLFDAQIRLNWNVNKPSLQCNQGLFCKNPLSLRHKTPAFPLSRPR